MLLYITDANLGKQRYRPELNVVLLQVKLQVCLIFSRWEVESLPSVLGLARTGLIFTGLQEEAQPGGLTQPGQTEPSIPYHVLSFWVPVGGSWAVGTHSRLGRAQRQFGPREQFCSAGSVLLVCFVYSPFSVSLLFLFPLFAVLLNCPYPDPPVSACFFPFSSAPQQGEGWPRGAFVAGRSQNHNSQIKCYEDHLQIISKFYYSKLFHRHW